MKRYINLLLLALTVTLSGCSFSYVVDYEITNDSTKSIIISYQTQYSEDIETSIISKGTTLRILEDQGTGTCTENKVEELRKIPFEILEIEDSNGKMVKKDLFEITNWRKEYMKDHDRGLVTVTITDESF